MLKVVVVFLTVVFIVLESPGSTFQNEETQDLLPNQPN